MSSQAEHVGAGRLGRRSKGKGQIVPSRHSGARPTCPSGCGIRPRATRDRIGDSRTLRSATARRPREIEVRGPGCAAAEPLVFFRQVVVTARRAAG